MPGEREAATLSRFVKRSRRRAAFLIHEKTWGLPRLCQEIAAHRRSNMRLFGLVAKDHLSGLRAANPIPPPPDLGNDPPPSQRGRLPALLLPRRG